MPSVIDVIGSYRQTVTTGAVTTIAAGTATAGHILSLRSATAGKAVRLRSLEVEFILTTAFGAAQEVGFDAYVARSYSAAHTGGTAIDFTGDTGKAKQTTNSTILTGRTASASALTAGTHTLDTNAVARGSAWCSAIGAVLGPRFYDFTALEPGGLVLVNAEGLVVRNTILMGATGVGKWHFTFDWDDVVVAA
jgi:hypothetical protein